MHGSAARTKWQAPEAGAHYAGERWPSERRRRRDPRLVAALLARHLPPTRAALLLDAPCGTGRLHAAVRAHGRYVGLDVSRSMLQEVHPRDEPGTAWLGGDVFRLPFRDATFDAVVCCRLLHHLREEAELEAALVELVRVSRGLLIASFWDAGSLAAWRRARFPARHRRQRQAIRRAALAAALERAGAEVVGWKHALRFLAQQAFVVARKRGGAGS